jgi:hypothetical protein
LVREIQPSKFLKRLGEIDMKKYLKSAWTYLLWLYIDRTYNLIDLIVVIILATNVNKLWEFLIIWFVWVWISNKISAWFEKKYPNYPPEMTEDANGELIVKDGV